MRQLTQLHRTVVLFSKLTSKGVAIDYPTIALHALGSQDGFTTVYLQLDLLTNDDDDIQTLTMHLIPKATHGEEPESTDGQANGVDGTNGTPATPNGEAAKALFEALSACADLNPDPMDEDEDGEGAAMPEPGAGGWITSENMQDFMDENGNWIGPEVPVLGAGAGQVRAREDGDDDEAAGAGEDTKWQRTG